MDTFINHRNLLFLRLALPCQEKEKEKKKGSKYSHVSSDGSFDEYNEKKSTFAWNKQPQSDSKALISGSNDFPRLVWKKISFCIYIHIFITGNAPILRWLILVTV